MWRFFATAWLQTVCLQATQSPSTDADGFSLGLLSPYTCFSQDLLACSAMFDLDMRKYSEPDLIQRLGGPILNLSNVHADLKFEPHVGSSDCSPDASVAMAEQFIQGSQVVGIVGGLISAAVQAVAPLASVYRVPQVTFGGAAAALGDRVLYPYLLRAYPPSSSTGRAMWAWMEEFNVPAASIVYSLEGLGEAVFATALDAASQAGRRTSVTGIGLPVLDEENVDWDAVHEACDIVRSVGSKFVLMVASLRSNANFVMYGMEEIGILYNGYQILGTAGTDVLDDGAEFSPSQGRPMGFQKMNGVPRGKLYPEFLAMWQKMVPDDIYGVEARDRMKIANSSIDGRPHLAEEDFTREPNAQCGFLLDAAYTFAVAINNLLNADVPKDQIRGSVLLEEMKMVEFEGITGTVGYDSNSDRSSDFELTHVLENAGDMLAMAVWSGITGEWLYNSGVKEVMWATGALSGTVPAELLACDPGQQRVDGDGFCEPCPHNWYSTGASGAEGCDPCGAGWVSSVEIGASSCEPCANGTFREIGYETCAPCPSGSFGSGAGQSACTTCSVGKYTAGSGYSACMACGAGRASEEFFTTLEIVEVKGVASWVYEVGASSNRSCGCDFNFRMDGADECVACTNGMRCSGMGDVAILPGYFAEGVSSTGQLTVFKCHGDDLRCSGGLPGQTCAAGRVGVTCAECIAGRTSGADGACVACAGSDGGAFVAVVVLFVTCLTVLYRYIDKNSRATQTTAALLFGIVLGLLVSVLQQLGVVAQLALHWEEPVKSLLGTLSLLSLDVEVLRLNCISSTGPSERFVLKVLFIFLSIGLTVVIHAVYVVVLHHGQFKKRMHSLVGAVGSVFIIFYIAVTATVLQPLQCETHPQPNPEQTLSGYPGVICWESSEHTEMLCIGLLAFVTVPVLFLAAVVSVVYRYPSRMRMGDAAFMQSFAFLFFRFRPSRYFFVLILMIRSFCVACVLVVPDTVLQLFVLQMVLLVGFAASLYFCPWRVAFANVVDCLGGGCVLLFVSMAGLFLADDDKHMRGIAWLAAGLIFAIIGMLPPTLMWVAYVKFIRVSKPFQFFLCHHKYASGVYTRLLKMHLLENSKVTSGVFLDSDNLDSLDRLFDYVGNDTLNLVVLCTQQIFTRPWCVGEMCTARIRKVHTVLVGMPTRELPREDFIESFDQRVEDLDVLVGHGLNLELVTDTLKWVHILPTINVPDVVNDDIMSSLASALVTRKYSRITKEDALNKKPSTMPARHGCYMLFDFSNMEAAATVFVLRKMLLPLMTSYMDSLPEPISTDTSGDVNTIVAICTRGVFEQEDVARILSMLSPNLPNMFPVLADTGFSFPRPDTNDYTVQMATQGSIASVESLQRAAAVIQQMFKSIAITFVAQTAGEGALRLAAEQVAGRLTTRNDGGGTLGGSAKDIKRAESRRSSSDSTKIGPDGQLMVFEVWA